MLSFILMNIKMLLGIIIVLASVVTMLVLKPNGNHAQMLGRAIGNLLCITIGAILFFKGRKEARRNSNR